MPTSIRQRLTVAIEMLTLVKPAETRATLAAFLMVFILMASYFILRPGT